MTHHASPSKLSPMSERMPIAASGGRFSTRHRVYIIGFWIVSLSLWLVPFFVTGWSKKPWAVFPKALSYQHNASALCTQELKRWRDFHIEWLRKDGSRFEMKEQLLFPVNRYGNRTRYDVILSRYNTKKGREPALLRLAQHAYKQGKELGVLGNEVVGVRFIVVYWPVGTPALAQPTGAWQDVKLSKIPTKWLHVLEDFEIKGSTVRMAKKPKTPETKSVTTKAKNSQVVVPPLLPRGDAPKKATASLDVIAPPAPLPKLVPPPTRRLIPSDPSAATKETTPFTKL